MMLVLKQTQDFVTDNPGCHEGNPGPIRSLRQEKMQISSGARKG